MGNIITTQTIYISHVLDLIKTSSCLQLRKSRAAAEGDANEAKRESSEGGGAKAAQWKLDSGDDWWVSHIEHD